MVAPPDRLIQADDSRLLQALQGAKGGLGRELEGRGRRVWRLQGRPRALATGGSGSKRRPRSGGAPSFPYPRFPCTLLIAVHVGAGGEREQEQLHLLQRLLLGVAREQAATLGR